MQSSIENEETIIDLAETEIYEAGLEVVCAALPCCTQIQQLALHGCAINDTGLANLIESMKESPTLVHVDLSNNQVTDAVIDKVAGLLRENQNLSKLILTGMKITQRTTNDIKKEFAGRLVL